MSLLSEHVSLRRVLNGQVADLYNNYCIQLPLILIQLYSDYAKGFDTAREAYIQWLKTSKQFRELVKIIEV